MYKEILFNLKKIKERKKKKKERKKTKKNPPIGENIDESRGFYAK